MSDDVKAFAAAVVADLRAGMAEWEELRAQAAAEPDGAEVVRRCEARVWAIRWAVGKVLLRAGLTDELLDLLDPIGERADP